MLFKLKKLFILKKNSVYNTDHKHLRNSLIQFHSFLNTELTVQNV